MLATHDDLAELAKDGIGLIGYGFMQHIVQLVLVAEAHATDADFRQQVVFANLAPKAIVVVVPTTVKGSIIQVSRDVAVGHVAAARKHVAVKAAIGDLGHIASEVHHHDTVFLILLNDKVAQFFGIIATLHRVQDGLKANDAGTEASGFVEFFIFTKSINPLFLGDHKQLIAAHDAASAVVALQHLGILGESHGA